MKTSVIRRCLNCNYSQAEVYENKNDYEKVSVCPKCNGASVDHFYFARYKQQAIEKRENGLKQFDVQRVESLMRYAEFLTDMNGAGVGDKGDKINRVIDLIHYEVGGYVEPIDEVVTAYADGRVVDKAVSLHPDVKEFIRQEVINQNKEARL